MEEFLSHAFLRNNMLPVLYLFYLYAKTKPWCDQVFKYVHGAFLVFIPVGYFAMNSTWENIASPIQYYLYYITQTFMLRDEPASDRVVKTVIGAATVGYLYEVPKWIGRSPFLLLRSSEHSLLFWEWSFISAIMFFYLYAEFKPTTPTVCTLCLYFIYCMVYITHLNWLFYASKYVGIQSVAFKRIPSILLVLSTMKTMHNTPRVNA